MSAQKQEVLDHLIHHLSSTVVECTIEQREALVNRCLEPRIRIRAMGLARWWVPRHGSQIQ